MCNFLIRFFYEFYLEICLSVLIHLTSMQVLMLQEVEAQVSIASWVLASLGLASIVLLIAFLISRFHCNGPYIESTYEPSSLKHSWWGIRRLSKTIHESNHDDLSH